MYKFLYKWCFCSWAHYKDRCYPCVWDQKVAIENNIEYKPNYWHCEKCHPCGEALDILLERVNKQNV
jgi:hypothetical protein